MKKRFAIFIAFCIFAAIVSPSAYAMEDTTIIDIDEATFTSVPVASLDAPGIAGTAQAAIVMEVSGDRVLFSKNANEQLPMASTTKIMTAILALENGKLDEVISVPPEGSGVEGSSMFLNVGEKITLENLLYGLMMWSGNDAAITISMHIGGTLENFLAMMNTKAKEIGAKNTHFANPNGLPSKDHYTTAEDLGKIAAYAMRNPKFVEIVSTQEKTIPWDGNKYNRSLRNKNKMLYNYEGANGIKTGFTKAAGRCLVSAALRDGVQLVSVVLNCGDMWGDSSKLLDYGFTQLHPEKVLSKGESLGQIDIVEGYETDRLELLAKDDIVIPLKKDEAQTVIRRIKKYDGLPAPVSKGQIIGKIELYLGDTMMAEQDIIAQSDVHRITYGHFVDKVIRDWLDLPLGERAATP